MPDDLELAFRMVDAADAVTKAAWASGGMASVMKADGSPVTEADVAAECAMLAVVQRDAPEDGFLGEEVGLHPGTGDRRWIADGIDGTRFFAAGAVTWGRCSPSTMSVSDHSPGRSAEQWDHAAPSLIVEEAGGRFTDHSGGRRLDTRTGVYSNGHCHGALLDALNSARTAEDGTSQPRS